MKQSIRPVRLFVLLSILFGSPGCSDEPGPEQKQADETLNEARKSVPAGNHARSRTLLLSALALDRKLGRTEQLAEEAELLAHNYRAGANIDSSLIFFRQALEMYKELGNRRRATAITLEIAATHRLTEEEHKAYEVLLEAQRLANVFGDAEGVRDIGWALLPVCRAVDNLEEEARILDELLKHYTATGEAGMQARVHFQFGMSALHRMEFNAAVERFLRALTLADQARDSLLAISALQRAAIAFGRMGKTIDAFQLYTDGLTRSDRTREAGAIREEMLIRVGNIYLQSGQFENARKFYMAAENSAIKRKNSLALGYLALQLGHCDFEAVGRREEAARRYKSALDLFTGYSYPTGIAYAALSLGVAAQRSQRPNEAMRYFKLSAGKQALSYRLHPNDDVYEDCQQAFLFLHQSTTSEALIEQLLAVGNYTEAFEHIERKNGREVFDMLNALDFEVLNDNLRLQLRDFKQRKGWHVAAERQLAAALEERSTEKELHSELRSALERAAGLMEDAAASVLQVNAEFEAAVSVGGAGLADVQQYVPAGVALVEYALTRRSVYMYIVTPSEIAVQLAATEKRSLLSTVDEFISLVRSRSAETRDEQRGIKDRRLRDLSSSLYSIFVRPLEGNIAGVSKVIAVLPAEISLLPLHALRSEGRGYVIEQQMVSYLPTANSLKLTGSRISSTPEIVGIGNPGGTEWDVEYELRDIRAFYKDARLYFDQKATLATLQKEKADVLHYAGAFHFNARAPANSYLILSDGKSFNTNVELRWGSLFSLPGFPTAIISNLAAESGFHAGQPLIFLMNGSANVILTPFPPPRKTKKFFGEVFYTTLLSGGSAQNAYRQALLDMIKNPEYSSPHHWAPFFHWGK